MTPLPKRRHSHHRTGRRRSQISLAAPTIVKCSNCQQPSTPHQACPSCGFYKGIKVI